MHIILLCAVFNSVLRKSRVVVGGLHAPNLLKQLGLLAVALVRDERSGGLGRTRRCTGCLGRLSTNTRTRLDGGNRATQRFRQHVVETHGKAEQDEEERHDVAPKQRLVQVKVVDNENGGELQRDEGERVLGGGDQLVLVANVHGDGHEQPVQPRKRDGHFISGKHAHIWVLQGHKLAPHGRRLCANKCDEPQ